LGRSKLRTGNKWRARIRTGTRWTGHGTGCAVDGAGGGAAGGDLRLPDVTRAPVHLAGRSLRSFRSRRRTRGRHGERYSWLRCAAGAGQPDWCSGGNFGRDFSGRVWARDEAGDCDLVFFTADVLNGVAIHCDGDSCLRADCLPAETFFGVYPAAWHWAS